MWSVFSQREPGVGTVGTVGVGSVGVGTVGTWGGGLAGSPLQVRTMDLSYDLISNLN